MEIQDLVLLALCTFETIEICLLVMLVLGSYVIAMFDISQIRLLNITDHWP